MGIKAKFLSAFSLRKLPGHAIWVLGVVWKLLDIAGHLDVFSRMVEGMGGTPAMLANVLLSPLTSVGMIAIGISYVVFVGEPEKGVQRHVWWPYVGWAIFAISLISMVGIVGYGALEFALRRAYDEGAAGIARGTPDVNTPSHPQRPLSIQTRNLQPDQVRLLKEELPNLRLFMDHILIGYTNLDGETLTIANDYMRLFDRSGITPTLTIINPRGPEDEGLLVEVEDTNNIPLAVKKLLEAFDVANIKAAARAVKDKKELFGNDFVLFVAPAHVD